MHHLIFIVTYARSIKEVQKIASTHIDKYASCYMVDYYQPVAALKQGDKEYKTFEGYERFPIDCTETGIKKLYKKFFQENSIFKNDKIIKQSKKYMDEFFKVSMLSKNNMDLYEWVESNTVVKNIANLYIRDFLRVLNHFKNTDIIKNNYNFWISEYADIGERLALINFSTYQEHDNSYDKYIIAYDLHT